MWRQEKSVRQLPKNLLLRGKHCDNCEPWQPAETGFKSENPLPERKALGVTHQETGKSVNVTLLLLDGQGAEAKYTAMRWVCP